MGKLVDLTGQKFGRLTVIRKSAIIKASGALWECKCDCGGSSVANSLKLRTGLAVSCGCKKAEGQANFKHGYSKTSSTYKIWKGMRYRCASPGSNSWAWYGGRGIKVCQRWDDFEIFLSDMGERPPGLTIDRIDSDGNYEPSNCRWATPTEQATTNRGVHRKGCAPHNKTSDVDLLKMREMRSSGAKLREIGAHFGMAVSVICGLVKHGPRGVH